MTLIHNFGGMDIGILVILEGVNVPYRICIIIIKHTVHARCYMLFVSGMKIIKQLINLYGITKFSSSTNWANAKHYWPGEQERGESHD